MDAERIAAGLGPFIAAQVGADRVEVHGLERFSGGASRETWALDITLHRGSAAEAIPAVFRTDPSVHTEARPARELEYTLLRAAWENGVVVPEPLWRGPREIFGTDFFLMRRVPGEALGPRLVRHERYARARALLPEQLAVSLARIHAIPLARYPELARLPAPPPGMSGGRFQLDTFEQQLRAVDDQPHPVFELAIRWLRARAPADGARALVHGDYRLGNVMFDEDGLTGVLDWENAHIGDPLQDIGYLMMRSWRFGGEQPVAGVGALEPFLAAYTAAGGSPIDRDRLAFWEAFAYLQWGVQALQQGARYTTGEHRNVEHALIGRRTAETEIELLRFMQEAR